MRGMHGNQRRRTDDKRYRLQIRKRIVGHVLDQMRRNDDRAFCCHIQRVAIRVRTDDGVRSYPATGAGAVFHHDWLAKRLLQLRSKQSRRSEEHTSELQSLMRISYAVFCSTTKKTTIQYKEY